MTDTLKTDELKVVGKGNSPYYISLSRGSTTIGTGTISGFVVVPEKTFDLDVYTEMYVQVAGAKDLTAYTKAYKRESKDCPKENRSNHRRKRKDPKVGTEDKANEKLAKAQKKLDDGKRNRSRSLRMPKSRLPMERRRFRRQKKRLRVESRRLQQQSRR